MIERNLDQVGLCLDNKYLNEFTRVVGSLDKVDKIYDRYNICMSNKRKLDVLFKDYVNKKSYDDNLAKEMAPEVHRLEKATLEDIKLTIQLAIGADASLELKDNFVKGGYVQRFGQEAYDKLIESVKETAKKQNIPANFYEVLRKECEAKYSAKYSKELASLEVEAELALIPQTPREEVSGLPSTPANESPAPSTRHGSTTSNITTLRSTQTIDVPAVKNSQQGMILSPSTLTQALSALGSSEDVKGSQAPRPTNLLKKFSEEAPSDNAIATEQKELPSSSKGQSTSSSPTKTR